MVKLEVEVTTRSRAPGVVGRRGVVLRVKLAAPPVEGRANKELIATVARFLGLPKSNLELSRGATSRRKLLLIAGMDEAGLAAALARAQSEED